MAILKKPTSAPVTATKSAPFTRQGPAPTPAKAKPAADPFAQKYNEAEASTKGGYIPPLPGSYNVLLTEAQAIDDDPKKTAFFEFTIMDDGPMEGKTCRIYFNFVDEDGNDGQGMPFFKQAMTMLGHNEPLESWDHMSETIAEIAAEQPWVIINVVKKGKYTNVFIDSVPENQDEKPVLP